MCIRDSPGVGRKTAIALLEYFGSLDNVYANLESVHEVNVRGAKTLSTKLEMYREDAMLARQLTSIACNAPVDRPVTGLRPGTPDLGGINALYDEVNIGMALRRQAERIANLLE